MFYDFNGSSSAANTAQNFYKPTQADILLAQPGSQEQEDVEKNVDPNLQAHFRGNGDRVPTRERGHRSANLNYRRRGQTKGAVMPQQEDFPTEEAANLRVSY